MRSCLIDQTGDCPMVSEQASKRKSCKTLVYPGKLSRCILSYSPIGEAVFGIHLVLVICWNGHDSHF